VARISTIYPWYIQVLLPLKAAHLSQSESLLQGFKYMLNWIFKFFKCHRHTLDILSATWLVVVVAFNVSPVHATTNFDTECFTPYPSSNSLPSSLPSPYLSSTHSSGCGPMLHSIPFHSIPFHSISLHSVELTNCWLTQSVGQGRVAMESQLWLGYWLWWWWWWWWWWYWWCWYWCCCS